MKTSEKSLNKRLGKKIKEQRKSMDLSAKTFADILEISEKQLDKYEAGEVAISAAKLYTICLFLDISVDYFYPVSCDS